MSRKSQERVQVTIDSEDWGVFDTFSGGEADSEETRHRPGGMGVEKSLGGMLTVGNVTISRLYELERDHDRCRALMNRAGKARIVAGRARLDTDGNPFGEPTVYTGIVKTVTPPESDSMSDDTAMLEIVFVPDGSVS